LQNFVFAFSLTASARPFIFFLEQAGMTTGRFLIAYRSTECTEITKQKELHIENDKGDGTKEDNESLNYSEV